MSTDTTVEPFDGAENDDFDPFDAPKQGGKFPALAQLENRLCIWEAQGAPTTQPDRFNPGTMKPRLTCNITFLDGETITEKIDKEGDATPLPEPIEAGKVMAGMFISQTKMVSQLRGRRMVLGRVVKLPKIPGSTNNRAWGITDIPALAREGNAQAKADLQLAKEFIAGRDPFA